MQMIKADDFAGSGVGAGGSLCIERLFVCPSVCRSVSPSLLLSVSLSVCLCDCFFFLNVCFFKEATVAKVVLSAVSKIERANLK